jgi:hypothetical protein
MNKTVPLIICILTLLLLNVNAQYKLDKTRYDYKNYNYLKEDPHSPVSSAVASFLIPGLGQMICGEGLRGTGFLLAWASGLTVSVAGLLYTSSVTESDPDFWQVQTTSKRMIIGGLAGAAAVWIWSIADAQRVAKVNNLAFRDKNRTSFNIRLQPYINLEDYDLIGKAPVGFSLKITF